MPTYHELATYRIGIGEALREARRDCDLSIPDLAGESRERFGPSVYHLSTRQIQAFEHGRIYRYDHPLGPIEGLTHEPTLNLYRSPTYERLRRKLAAHVALVDLEQEVIEHITRLDTLFFGQLEQALRALR